MKWTGRLLSAVGFLLLGGGLFYGALLAGGVCFDVCPSNVTAATAGFTLGCLLPGLVVAGLGWVLCLLFLVLEERRWRALLVLGILPVCVIGSIVTVLAHNAGRPFPLSEGEIRQWEESLTGVFIFLLAWPLVTVLSTLALPREGPANVPEQSG